METLKMILKKILELLVKLPIECIKIVKNLVCNLLKKISLIFNKESNSVKTDSSDKPKLININDEKNNEDKPTTTESNKDDEDKISDTNCNKAEENKPFDLDSKKDNENKPFGSDYNKDDKDKSLTTNNTKNDKDEILTTDNIIDVENKTSTTDNEKDNGEKHNIESGIKIELKKYLFEDIEKNEENFNKIFEGIEKIRDTLSLPEKDLEIYLKKIASLEKEIIKLKNKTQKEIDDEDIEEDEYSEILTNKFVNLLAENYKTILQTTLNNIVYKKDKCFEEAFEIFEKFLLELGFEKKNIFLETISIEEKNIVYFDIIDIETKNELEDNKVKEITLQPYFLDFKGSDEDSKVYIPGQLIYYKYRRKD